MRKFFILIAVVVLLGVTLTAMADSINGTVKGTIFEARKGEKLLGQQSSMGAKGDELVSVEVLVYGIPCEQEPTDWKENPIFAYQNIVIQNPAAVSVNSRTILSAIGMALDRTFNGVWQGNRVTRVLIKVP